MQDIHDAETPTRAPSRRATIRARRSRFGLFASLGAPLLVFLFGMLAMPESAHARRRKGVNLILITYGDNFKEQASVDPSYYPAIEEVWGLRGRVVAGYYYQSFGLFYLDIWTWGGTHVIQAGGTIAEVSDEDLLEMTGKSSNQLGKPWTYRFPPGLIALLIALAVIIRQVLQEEDWEE